MRAIFTIYFLFFCLSIKALAENVTDSVEVTTPGFELNDSTSTYQQEVTLKNIGKIPIGKPLSLLVKLNFKKVKLTNSATAVADGVYVVPLIISETEFAPGDRAKVLLELADSNSPGVKASIKVEGHWPDKSGLPGDPGSNADATLLGVDKNNNGIRDDIDRYINFTFSNSEKARLALTDLAKSFQKVLQVPDSDVAAASDVYTQIHKNYDCLFYCFEVEGRKKANMLKEVFFNTSERRKAFKAYEKLLSGAKTKVEAMGAQSCSFDVDGLND